MQSSVLPVSLMAFPMLFHQLIKSWSSFLSFVLNGFPVITRLSNLCNLVTCLENFDCLFLMVLTSFFPCSTTSVSTLVIFWVYVISLSKTMPLSSDFCLFRSVKHKVIPAKYIIVILIFSLLRTLSFFLSLWSLVSYLSHSPELRIFFYLSHSPMLRKISYLSH